MEKKLRQGRGGQSGTERGSRERAVGREIIFGTPRQLRIESLYWGRGRSIIRPSDQLSKTRGSECVKYICID